MVLVFPVQPLELRIDTRAARDLQSVDEFLIKLRNLRQQFNATCIQFSNRKKQINNLPTAADYYYESGCVGTLGNTFYKIHCEMNYELDKVRSLISDHVVTIAQEIKGNSSEKHAECLEVSKRLQRLGDEILDSKSPPSS